MPFEDADWNHRYPECFKTLGDKSDVECDCGVLIVRRGSFRGTQDHPWRQPRIECDCGSIHQIVGLRCDCRELEET